LAEKDRGHERERKIKKIKKRICEHGNENMGGVWAGKTWAKNL
jgi:hypothetical protein